MKSLILLAVLLQPLEDFRISFPLLEYPLVAKQASVQGKVELSFKVDKSGKPQMIELISGHPLLAATAKSNLGGWTFYGAKPDKGIKITYVFLLDQRSSGEKMSYDDAKKTVTITAARPTTQPTSEIR